MKTETTTGMTNLDLALKYLGPQNIHGFDGPMGWLDSNVRVALKIAAGQPDLEGREFINEQYTSLGQNKV